MGTTGWSMIRFEVTNSGEYWDVEGFDPDNPNDRVLANRSMTQAYAEMLAADLNRLAEIEPTTAHQPASHRGRSNQAPCRPSGGLAI